MKLPHNAGQLSESVFDTTSSLIELGFWGIERSRLYSWWSQFVGPDEKYFASCLLDQTLYRTRPQLESSLRALFRNRLNRRLFPENEDTTLVEKLTSWNDPKIRLVPVICETDPPTKSGPLIIRRLQRILNLNDRWMCWPWQVEKAVNNKQVNTIIFVDDFLGSGSQFVKFFGQWSFDDFCSKDISFHYAPIVAHSSGVNHIRENLPHVQLTWVEGLDEANQFFSEDSWRERTNDEISAEEAKDWYLSFCDRHKIGNDKVHALGFGELELLLAFSHATPNNSMPIIWFHSENWNPLMER